MSDEPGSPRNATRAPVKLKIKFRSATLTQFIERYSVDVSKGGIFIRTKDPLEVGTKLRFEFQLQDGSPLIVGEGTVVWIREHDPSRKGVAPGMGVRFDQLQPESKEVLAEILNRKSGAAPLMSDAEVAKKATAQAGRPDAPPLAPSPAAPALTPPKAEEKPAEKAAAPVPPVSAPVKAEDKPEDKPEEPAKAEDKPEEPAKAEEKPEEPAKAEDKPEEPAKAEEKSEDKPADKPDDKAEPAKAEDKPSKAEDKPAKAEDKPSKAEDKPSKAEDKPEKKPVEPAKKAEPKPTSKPPAPVAKDRPVAAAQDAARAEKSGGVGRYVVVLLIILLLGAGAWVLFTQVLTDKTPRGQRGGDSGTAMGPVTPDAEAMRPVATADAAVEAMRPEPVMQAAPECADGILADVVSEPAGGKIFLGSKDTGQVTPGKICVPKNRKKKVLRVDLDMYRPGYLYFRGVKNNKLDKIVLKPITYRVVIKTNPKRARVYVNGKYTGETTLSIKLDPALKTLKLKIMKKNHETREITLERANIKWRKQSRFSFVYPVAVRLKVLYIPGRRPMDPPRPMDADPMDADPMDADPMDADPMDAMRPEPMRVEPRRVEPRRVEPRRVEPRRVEPRRVEPMRPAAAE